MVGLTVEAVIDRLGCGDSADLVIGDSASLPPARRHIWASAQTGSGQRGLLRGQIPGRLLQRAEHPRRAGSRGSHYPVSPGAWSESRAQLLIVVLPTEVRILDARVPPGGDLTPLARGRLGSAALEPFTRDNLLRGRAADLLPSSSKRTSVVERLRSDLRPARRRLIDKGLAEEVANQLFCFVPGMGGSRSITSLDGTQS